ncbi:MAG: Smr/MutS family protein [Saprospiraceae bacterium]
MQLSPGQTILLKHTRERAKVISQMEHGQYLVEASLDHERFPVHEDDIDPVLGTQSSTSTESVQEQAGDIRLYPDVNGPQVQFAFLPVGELNFNGYLLNFSEETLVYAARMISKRGQQWAKHGLLGPTRGLEMGHLYRDLLNESASVEIQVSRKAEAGTDSMQEKILKLKPKLFHKSIKTVSWYPDQISVFDVFTKVKIVREVKPTIQEYTKENAPPVAEIKKVHAIRKYGVTAAAEFNTELDLHIEKLVDDHTSMTPTEMLEVQLKNMDDYLNVAIRLGIQRVFLIHGKGKGSLRNRIHDQLSKMGDLEGFKHEFHPKYGHGATEVMLRP